MKNKLFLIFFIFILITSVFSLNSFALDITYGNDTVSLPEFFNDYKNIFIFKSRESDYVMKHGYLFVFIGNDDFYYNGRSIYVDYHNNENFEPFKYFDYISTPIPGSGGLANRTYFAFSDLPNLSLDYFKSSTGVSSSSFSGLLQQDDIVYLNCDIYDTPDNKNLVFRGAPVTVEQLTIPTIQQVEEIPQAMNKVLAMIIPIGLIIFGIGLLIYLMRLVISRMQ